MVSIAAALEIRALATAVTADGATQVLSCTIDASEIGVWLASVEVDADAPPKRGTEVNILIASQATDGGEPATFTGTVLWGAPWQGRSRFWMTGGAGGLRKLARARNYVQGPVPLRLWDLLGDIMDEAGEVFDDSITEDSLAPYTLGRWHRPACSGLAAISKLCEEFALAWRLTPAGKLLVLPLDYPVDPVQHFVCDPGDDGADQCFVVAPDRATLWPATTVLGRQVNRVVYELTEDGLRARCFYGAGTTEGEDWEAAVRVALPELPYLPSYEATVVSQRPSGMLEVLCDDTRIGPLDNVILIAGGPRMTLRAKQGQRVRVLFAAGSPKRYYAVGFEQDAAATAGVARVGDRVAIGTLSGVAPPGGGPVSFTFEPSSLVGGLGTTGLAVDFGGAISTGSNDQKLAPGA